MGHFKNTKFNSFKNISTNCLSFKSKKSFSQNWSNDVKGRSQLFGHCGQLHDKKLFGSCGQLRKKKVVINSKGVFTCGLKIMSFYCYAVQAKNI